MNFKKLISKILHIIVFDEKINTNDLDLDDIKVRKKSNKDVFTYYIEYAA